MLRKMFSLGALVVVAVTFGASNAAAKPNTKPQGNGYGQMNSEGFSDGRFMQGGRNGEGFSDGR